MTVKLIGAGMGGVFVPIITEFAAKGADIHPSFPVKISGVVGVVAGAVPIIAVYGIDRVKRMSEDNKNAMLAFGASSLATGLSILLLEQLRKSAGYTFRDVEIGAPRGEGLTAPVGQIIKEI
jgi:hypothetical protein